MAPTLRDQRVKEVLTIGTLFLVISGLTAYLVPLFVGAWEREGIAYHLVWGIARELGNTDVIFILPTGLYFGLLTLVLLDRMKAVQGLLLGAGTLIGSVLLWYEGWLWENVAWIANVHVLIIGYVAGVLLGGGRKLYEEDWPYEFRSAIQWIFTLVAGAVAVALFETHVRYESPIGSTGGLTIEPFDASTLAIEPVGFVTNAALAGTFVVILHLFTGYEYRQSFMVLGPKRGGKTTLMAGAFHTADRMTEGNAGSNDLLKEYRYELTDGTSGFGNVEDPTELDEANRLEFDYDHGQLLKKRVEVTATDHGGEMIKDLNGEVRKALSTGNTRSWLGRYPRLASLVESLGGSGTPDFKSDAHREVAESIVDSDALIVTIPLDDFVEGAVSHEHRPPYYENPRTNGIRPDPATYLVEYDKLLDGFQNGDGKDVLVVATMADLVIEEFKSRYRPDGEPLTSDLDYGDLDAWITDEVLGTQGERLLEYTDDDRVLSVHFEMNPNDHAGTPRNPEPNPVLPNGDINFVGGERLLRELGE